MRNLISLASTDGVLDDEEKALINVIGIRRGLKEWQVSELLEENVKHEFFIPDTVSNRMNLLYDVMQIVYADGRVSPSEMAFVRTIIEALKLEEEVVHELIGLFQNQTPSPAEWNDFIEAVVENESKKFMTIL